MTRVRDLLTPGCRGSGHPGVVFLTLLLAFAGCEPGGEAEDPSVLELEDGETVELGGGAVVRDVVLRFEGRGIVEPDTVRVHAGDVVRFTAADPMQHAVVFDRTTLSPAAAAFLDQTGQLRGPPLIETGASWVVSFEDAPPGAYPFADLSQDVRGLVLVAAPTDE